MVDPDDFLLDPDTVAELVMLDDVDVVLQQEARDRLHDSGPFRHVGVRTPKAVAWAPPVRGLRPLSAQSRTQLWTSALLLDESYPFDILEAWTTTAAR